MNLLDEFTSPEEEQAYIEQMRKMSFSEKFAILSKLSQEARDAVRAEILQEYPNVSEQERKLIFVERCYGKELAEGLRKELQKRRKSGLDEM